MNLPTLVSPSFLKFQLSIAAVTPVFFFLLLFITIVIITCQVLRVRRRKKELQFHETVVNRHVDVLEILIERLPEDHSEASYTKLLEFVERILTISVPEDSESPSPLPPDNDPSDEEGRHGHRERDNLEMVDFSAPAINRKSTALLKTLGNVIQTNLENPRLRPHLDRQMSTLIGDSSARMQRLDRPSSEVLLDIGYSGSDSVYSADQELDQKLEV